MIAIIFEVTPKSDKKADYLDLAAEMRPIIEEVEGFGYRSFYNFIIYIINNELIK